MLLEKPLFYFAIGLSLPIGGTGVSINIEEQINRLRTGVFYKIKWVYRGKDGKFYWFLSIKSEAYVKQILALQVGLPSRIIAAGY